MGVTLDDVVERISISRRTAQRILHALEAQFPETESAFDDEGRISIADLNSFVRRAYPSLAK